MFAKSGGTEAEMTEIKQRDLENDEVDIHNEHDLRVDLEWYNLFKKRQNL